MRVMIDDGWEGTGKKGVTLGDDLFLNDEWFTPVLWDDGDGADFVRTASLCIDAPDGKDCSHKSHVMEVEVCPKCGNLLTDIPTTLGLEKKNPFKVRK